MPLVLLCEPTIGHAKPRSQRYATKQQQSQQLVLV